MKNMKHEQIEKTTEPTKIAKTQKSKKTFDKRKTWKKHRLNKSKKWKVQIIEKTLFPTKSNILKWKPKNEKHEKSKSLEKTDCKNILCEENKI